MRPLAARGRGRCASRGARSLPRYACAYRREGRMKTNLDALAAGAAAVPYHLSLGVRVETLTPDHARLRVPYRDENSNPGRALHGGVAASLIDIAGVLVARAGVADMDGIEPGALDLSGDHPAAGAGGGGRG